MTYRRGGGCIDAFALSPSQNKKLELCDELAIEPIDVLEPTRPGNVEIIRRSLNEYLTDLGYREGSIKALQRTAKEFRQSIVSQKKSNYAKANLMDLYDDRIRRLNNIIQQVMDCLHFQLIPEAATVCDYFDDKSMFSLDYEALHLVPRERTVDLVAMRTNYEFAQATQLAHDNVRAGLSQSAEEAFQRGNSHTTPEQWCEIRERNARKYYQSIFDQYAVSLKSIASIQGESKRSGLTSLEERLRNRSMTAKKAWSGSIKTDVSLLEAIDEELVIELESVKTFTQDIQDRIKRLDNKWREILPRLDHLNSLLQGGMG